MGMKIYKPLTVREECWLQIFLEEDHSEGHCTTPGFSALSTDGLSATTASQTFRRESLCDPDRDAK
jgi:hypothetical protein